MTLLPNYYKTKKRKIKEKDYGNSIKGRTLAIIMPFLYHNNKLTLDNIVEKYCIKLGINNTCYVRMDISNCIKNAVKSGYIDCIKDCFKLNSKIVKSGSRFYLAK